MHIGGEGNGAALTQGMGNRKEQDLASEKLYPLCCLSQAGFLALSMLAGTAGCFDKNRFKSKRILKAFLVFCATAPPHVTQYILNAVLVSGIRHLLIKFMTDIKISGVTSVSENRTKCRALGTLEK